MTFLGYDRARLDALRRRLGDVTDEATRLRFDDPDAGDAAAAYRRAVDLVTAWRPTLVAIDGCAFGSPYQPVLLDVSDPARLDLVRPGDAAWATVTDPRAGFAVDAADHARHVAEFLATVDITTVLNDPRRADELARALTAATSEQPGVFFAALGPERFMALSGDLARVVAQRGTSGEASRQAGVAEQFIATLASGLSAAERSGAAGEEWNDALADGTDPYTVALVVRHASLAADELARIAVAAWQRWGRTAGDDTDEMAAAGAPTPALLLDVLAADPVAARRALERFTDADLALLFGSSLDADHVLPVLLASADPHVGPPDDVEASMVNVLGFLADHHDLAAASRVIDGLGAYAGPYLEHLFGACDLSSYPARHWDLRGATPEALLGWVVRSPTAAASVQAYLDAIVTTRFGQLAATAPGAAADGPLLYHLGAIAGAVDAIVGEAHVFAAHERNAIWQATTEALAGAVAAPAFAGLPGFVTSKVVSLAVTGGIHWIIGQWQDHQGFGAPVTVDAVIAAEGDSIEAQRSRREAAYLGAVFAAGRSQGTLPASAAPPAYDPGEPYLVTRNRWLAAAQGSDDTAARSLLWHAANDFDAGMSAALTRFRAEPDQTGEC